MRLFEYDTNVKTSLPETKDKKKRLLSKIEAKFRGIFMNESIEAFILKVFAEDSFS